MKFFNVFTYVLLLLVCLNQTACNTYSPELVLPQQNLQARTSGGGTLIVLDDPCAVPEYSTSSYTTTSNSNGCLSIDMQLSANCSDVVIAYRPSTESTWEGVLTQGTYSNGTVRVDYILPCVNQSTEYIIKITTIPMGKADDIQVGDATTSCPNCE